MLLGGGRPIVYYAKTQRGVLSFLLVIVVASIIRKSSDELLYFQILLTAFIFLTIFIQFKLKIGDSDLIYQIFFFTVPIYKKVLFPNQIIHIKFKRLGWTKKGAIIQVKKGVNIRIVNFVPKKVLADLIGFANKNDITITKTKDYLILDK